MTEMAKRKPEDVDRRARQIIMNILGDAYPRGREPVVPANLTDEARLVEDLGVDSLDRVELVMAFEEEFGLTISDEDAEKLATVKETIDYLQAAYAAKTGGAK